MEIQSLIQTLNQLCGFIEQVNPELYAISINGRSPVGAHTRHCIEHVDCLLGALDNRVLDYDVRKRDPLFEQSASLALAKLKSQIQILENMNLEAARIPVQVRAMISCDPPAFSEVPSHFAREILFVMSHTIHHMALMKTLDLVAKETVPHLGMAPSTLAYQTRSGTAK